MNYFEAYRIVQAYNKALAMSKSKYDMLYPLSSVANTKEEIWDAHKLFIAHIFLYSSRTPEEFEKIYYSARYIEMFYDDCIANRVNYLSNYVKKNSIFITKSKRQQAENELKMLFPMDLGTSMLAATQKVDQIITQVLPVQKELLEGVQQKKYDNFNRFLLTIAGKVYEAYNLPHTPDDDATFLPYKLHRANMDLDGAKEFYGPYMDIIFDEKNR